MEFYDGHGKILEPFPSKRINKTTCEVNCQEIDGHLPYLYEVDSVLDQLFDNGKINSTDYPIFIEDEWEMRSSLSEAKGF